MLAVHALGRGDLSTAEVALAALNLFDKVRLIQKIHQDPQDPQSKLEACLLLNKNEKARQLLRNSSNDFLVVRHLVKAFKFSEAWTKAQETGMEWVKDYVLFRRQRFVEETANGVEFNDFFKRLKPRGTLENVRSQKKAFLSK